MRSRVRTARLFKKVVSSALKLPENLTVSQWAEKYRILDESSAFSGHWNNDVTPYLKDIMDSLNDRHIREINFVKSTQVGGTESLINMLGWVIMNDPAQCLIVYPTDDLAKDISTDRLRPSLLKTPEIEALFYENRSKILNLKFRGMNLYLNGANSPSKLASKPIKYLFFDEIDKLGGASSKEASPYNLAKERTKTHNFDKKIFTTSTPTLRSGYVWKLHEKADEQKEYFVPCPHCGEYITLKFKNIHIPGLVSRSLEEAHKEGATNEELAEGSVYVCQECGCLITDREKIKAVRKGEWRTVNKECVAYPEKVSFWINSLYSRFVTWKDIILEFLNTKDDPDEFQNFVNSWLAEPWEDSRLKTSEELVMERQTHLPALIVPSWAKMLTGGIDVQENCIYWTIRAWGDYLTSQNIAHGQGLSLQDVEDVMNSFYESEAHEKFLVSLVLVDSGNDTDNVYDFCALNPEWALPCKGSSNPMQTHFKLSVINKSSSKACGMNLVLVDTGKYKDMIAGRMKKANGRGSWMVYSGCDNDYAQQVTAEHKVNVRTQRGSRQEWVKKKSHGDNHYLDAEVYAMAAADIQGVRMLHLNNTVAPKNNATDGTTKEEEWINANDDWI